jgi:hypothetical protein
MSVLFNVPNGRPKLAKPTYAPETRAALELSPEKMVRDLGAQRRGSELKLHARIGARAVTVALPAYDDTSPRGPVAQSDRAAVSYNRESSRDRHAFVPLQVVDVRATIITMGSSIPLTVSAILRNLERFYEQQWTRSTVRVPA